MLHLTNTHPKKTKIVATLGPASDSEEKIAELLRAGVNVFRFNMKHADVAWHEERIVRVQKVADEIHMPVGILIDLQGPEIRIETANKQEVMVKKGEPVFFAPTIVDQQPSICIPHPEVFQALAAGDTFSIDDGFIEFVVDRVENGGFYALPMDSAAIKHRKGLNLVGKDVDLPSLIDDDFKKLDMAAKQKVDFVALSFCRSRRDIEILKAEMKKRSINALVVAKIESQAALDHLDEIIEATDTVMVARGDLGIEVPIEQLAYWQKTMIEKCREACKPVITATQMLESMITHPRPTRAEATDVANAVFDGTDAVMLSAETANGQYPVKAVQAMARIAQFTEQHNDIEPVYLSDVPKANLTNSIAHAAMSLLHAPMEKKIDAIVVFTETGFTARSISSFRPTVPIIAITDQQKTVETLSVSFGVESHYMEFPTGRFVALHESLERLMDQGVLTKGQCLLVIHGEHWKEPGLTNALSVVHV